MRSRGNMFPDLVVGSTLIPQRLRGCLTLSATVKSEDPMTGYTEIDDVSLPVRRWTLRPFAAGPNIGGPAARIQLRHHEPEQSSTCHSAIPQK